MVFDRETGRSKGYGFAEYIDAETAASAVRNLDNYEIMGRKLRVDYSSQGYVGKEGYPGREGYAAKEAYMVKELNYPDGGVIYTEAAGYTTITGGGGRYGIPNASALNAAATTVSSDSGHNTRYGVPILPAGPAVGAMETTIPKVTQTASFLPKLPHGIEMHPNLTTPDSISQTLAAVPIPQLLRTLTEMKELATTDPLKATELLRQCPQLSYAIFQSLIMMNLVEPGVLAQLLDPNNTAGMYNQAHNAFMTTHLSQTIPHQPSPMVPMTTHIPTTSQLNYFTFPGQPQESFATQVGHQQQKQQQRMQGIQEPDKAMLLQRVMVLTQEEIARLPKEQQQQVLLLKHRLVTEGMPPHAQPGF